MQGFFLMAALAAYAGAIYISLSMVSDIQLGIVCVLAVGGTVLLGIVVVLEEIRELFQTVKAMSCVQQSATEEKPSLADVVARKYGHLPK